MFDFGFWELAIVLVVALIVVGPDKLPALAIKIRRWVVKAKQYMRTVRADIESEIKSAELKEMLEKQQSEISELRGMLNETSNEVQNSIANIAEEATTTKQQALDQEK